MNEDWGIVDRVTDLGLIYAFGRYEIRLRYAVEKLKEYRIFNYKGHEVIIIEILPRKNKLTILVEDIKSGWKEDVNVVEFFDKAVETEYVLSGEDD
jgi:hypothetical protein